jgi:mannose-6-phosphate isomerase-like protein (cupin superfamily)
MAIGALAAWGFQSPRRPLSFTLACAGAECPLLEGAPQSAGMRSGFVRLAPGASVGWHSTAQNEESLVVLRGQGEALFDGFEKRPFAAPASLYVPPATRHNVSNTGHEVLEYVYVVTPAAAK